jgi:hypothetical protein
VTTFSVTNLSPNKYFFEVKAFNKNSTPGTSDIVDAFVGEPIVINETPNFADHRDLTTNGIATFFDSGPPFGTVVLLTNGGFSEAGSLFSNPKLDIRGFTTTFTFAFVGGTNPIADGMTFVIQGNSSTALGGAGGGLGYQGIPNSVAVTFRAFTSSQLGLGVNGSFVNQVPITGGIDFNAAAHAGGVEPFQVTITYDGTTLNTTITDLITGKSFTAPSQTINIPLIVGGDTGYVGFTAGTGGLATTAAVGSWTYNPTTGNLSPLAPSNLAVVNVTTHDENRDDAALTWVCHSYNETGFAVQRSTDGVQYTTIASLPPNSISYDDLKVDPGTYYYRVYAFNGNGNSLFSNVDSVVLGAPRETTTAVDHSGGFTSHGDLTANGSASFAAVARLTDGGSGEAGSIFTTSRVLVSNFDTTFTFQMHDGTTPSADGMAFVIQADSPHALGGAGGGLGYGSDTPGGPVFIPDSIAIKFDLFSNAGEGIDSTGLFTHGASPTIGVNPGDVSIDMTGTGIDLHSQHLFQVDLTYDGTTLTETIMDLNVTNPDGSHPTFTHSYTLDIATLIGGNVGYAGFTGGTGGLTTIADVLTWTYQFTEPKPGQPRLAAGGPAVDTGAPALTAAIPAALVAPALDWSLPGPSSSNPGRALFGNAQVPARKPDGSVSPIDWLFSLPGLFDSVRGNGQSGGLDHLRPQRFGSGGEQNPLAADHVLYEVFSSGDLAAPV